MRKDKYIFPAACVSLLLAIGVLIYGVLVLKQNPHIPLVFSTVIIMRYGVMNGNTWQEMRAGMIESISESIEAILIICLIGVTIGTWMAGGTVPAIIYYGFQVFSPRFFLVSFCTKTQEITPVVRIIVRFFLYSNPSHKEALAICLHF